MFSKNHYINRISLVSIGLINSLFIYNILKDISVIQPVLFFLFFIALFILAEQKIKTNKEKIIKILLLLFSPAVYYLVLVEQAILIDTLLLIFIMFLAEKYISKTKIDPAFIIFSFLFGVLLSANAAMFVVFIAYLLYLFRSDFKRMIVFAVSTAAIYLILSFTYTVINSGVTSPSNPFEVPSLLSFIPAWGVVLLFAITVYAGWMVSDFGEVLFAGGLLLLIPSLILIIAGVIKFGDYSTYTAVLYMSYCAIALLFFVLSVKEYKVDKFLGRVY